MKLDLQLLVPSQSSLVGGPVNKGWPCSWVSLGSNNPPYPYQKPPFLIRAVLIKTIYIHMRKRREIMRSGWGLKQLLLKGPKNRVFSDSWSHTFYGTAYTAPVSALETGGHSLNALRAVISLISEEGIITAKRKFAIDVEEPASNAAILPIFSLVSPPKLRSCSARLAITAGL